jgi:hypothetical protein
MTRIERKTSHLRRLPQAVGLLRESQRTLRL